MEGAFVGYEHRFACSAWEVRGSEAGSLWGRASLRSPGVGAHEPLTSSMVGFTLCYSCGARGNGSRLSGEWIQ